LDLRSARRGLGLSLGSEEQPTDSSEHEGGHDPGCGVTGGGQKCDDDRPDDEGEFVHHRFEGKCRGQPRGAFQKVGPPGTQHAGDRRDAGAGDPRSQEHEPSRLILSDRPEKGRAGDHEHRESRQQYPALPERIGRSAQQWPEQRRGHRTRGRDRPTERVGPGVVLDHEQTTQAHHRQGQATEEADRDHRQGVRGQHDLLVRPEHPAPLLL
jgi:hypothetical protein